MARVSKKVSAAQREAENAPHRIWKTAIYARLSDFDDVLRDTESLEVQISYIKEYINHRDDLMLLDVFADKRCTGMNFDRPEFERLLKALQERKIDCIVVKDFSRLGRNFVETGQYLEQVFPLFGVRFIAINDNYDSNNYKGTTLGMDVIVSNLVNTMYCRDAGKKLRTANQVKWRKGITTASAAPFGYQFDPDKKGAFIVDPPAAKIVRRIFDLAILGLGTREIAMMLNDENVPVPSVYNKENKAYGKETTYTIAPVILWDSSRVWKILTAYVYTGAMVLGKTKTLISGKSIVRTVSKGQQFITEGTHEAIVSREEFEKAQLVIKCNSHKVLMGGVDFPLKGKVRCGNCRRVMAHNFKQAVPTFWCREGLELVGQTQCTSEVFQVSDIENAVLLFFPHNGVSVFFTFDGFDEQTLVDIRHARHIEGPVQGEKFFFSRRCHVDGGIFVVGTDNDVSVFLAGRNEFPLLPHSFTILEGFGHDLGIVGCISVIRKTGVGGIMLNKIGFSFAKLCPSREGGTTCKEQGHDAFGFHFFG